MRLLFEPDEDPEEEESEGIQIQKQMLKRDYAAALRFEQRSDSGIHFAGFGNVRTEATKEAVEGSASDKIRKFFEEHKGAVIAAIAVLVLLIILIAAFGTMGSFISTAGEAFVQSTYLSSDDNIKAVDDAYLELEEKLQQEVNNVRSTHPGYDEYRYEVDEISHESYALVSYLTAAYGDYSLGDVQSELQALFNEQFTLTYERVTETKTRTVSETDPETGEVSYYTETYSWYVLVTKLRNKGLDAVVQDKMTEDQKKSYEVYQSCMGNRSYLFGETITAGNVASGGMSYEIPSEALKDTEFARMITEAEKYLGYPYVWGGSSPSTSFDCSGFVCWVVNHSGNGWNVGRTTADGLRSYCTFVHASEAQPGDLIFFQKTYDTAGASHVGIYVGDGMMIHCGNPIQYTSINTNYWQEHFLAFGRLK